MLRGSDGSYTSGVVDSEISDCTISNIGVNNVWGAGIRCAWGSSRNKILRNTIADTGRGGILCGDGSTDLIIRNNNVSGSGKAANGLGIELWGGNGGTGCDRGIVEDNTVDHWISIDNASYSAIRRNTVSDKTGATAIRYIGLEMIASNNCVFTDNLVDDGQQIGVSISNAVAKQYIYWGYNTIQYCHQWGAQIQGETNYAKYMYFYKTDFLNTLVNSSPMYPGYEGNGLRFNGNDD